MLKALLLLCFAIAFQSSIAAEKRSVSAVDAIRVNAALAKYKIGMGAQDDVVTVLAFLKSSIRYVTGNFGFCCGQGCNKTGIGNCGSKVETEFSAILHSYVRFAAADPQKLKSDADFSILLEKFKETLNLPKEYELNAKDISAFDDFILDIIANTPSRDAERDFFKSALKVSATAFSDLESHANSKYALEHFKEAKSVIKRRWLANYAKIMGGSFTQYADAELSAVHKIRQRANYVLLGNFVDFLVGKDTGRPGLEERMKGQANFCVNAFRRITSKMNGTL